MGIQQIAATDAYATLQADPRAVYLDVRTISEFEQGHPPGALNIPVVFIEPSGGPAKPNERFLNVVRQHVEENAVILVGCQSGMRSQRAAEILANAGYERIYNVQGGFGGMRDRTGRVLAIGWRDSGLPVDVGQPADRSYEALSAGKCD